MTDKLRESLSALMDDEANELELERLLKQSVADDDLRNTWMRYNLARHSASGDPIAYPQWDISKQVRDALDVPGFPTHSPGFRERMLRPLASLAVAASVAATVVFGGQQLAQLNDPDPYQRGSDLVINTPPVGFGTTAGATSVQAKYGLQPLPVLQPMTRSAYQDLAQQRMSKYSQAHAEQAALNSPQGLISFARVPQIRQ